MGKSSFYLLTTGPTMTVRFLFKIKVSPGSKRTAVPGRIFKSFTRVSPSRRIAKKKTSVLFFTSSCSSYISDQYIRSMCFPTAGTDFDLSSGFSENKAFSTCNWRGLPELSSRS